MPIKTEALVTRVIDGDTIVVNYEKQNKKTNELKVRLACIDAAEIKQPKGLEAKKYLEQRVLKKKIKLHIYDSDIYGRAIAKVYIGGKLVNLDLVQAGYAWVYESYLEPCKKEKEALRKGQADAQKKKLGIWSARKAIAPWIWRRKH